MKKPTLVSNGDIIFYETGPSDKAALSDSDFADWTYDSVKSILETLRIVDETTYFHCLRVGEVCRRLARDLGLNELQQKSAHFAGILHDIGKMGISAAILHKPSRLTTSEFDLMKNHSCMSESIIRPLSRQNKFIELILSGVRGHHERVDGSGYPDHLEGDQIPLYSRIILVCDTFDAMKHTRAYRNGLDNESIYSELKRCSGTQFDFQIVKTFLEAHPTWNDAQDIDQEVLARIGASTPAAFKKTA